MQRTNIYLAERQTEAMDILASQQGVSRAEVVRQLIDEGLYRRPTADAVQSAIAESFGVMRDASLPDRDGTQRDQHIEKLWEL